MEDWQKEMSPSWTTKQTKKNPTHNKTKPMNKHTPPLFKNTKNVFPQLSYHFFFFKQFSPLGLNLSSRLSFFTSGNMFLMIYPECTSSHVYSPQHTLVFCSFLLILLCAILVSPFFCLDIFYSNSYYRIFLINIPRATCHYSAYMLFKIKHPK